MKKNKIHPDSISMKAYDEMAKYYAKYVDTKPFNAYYERPATISLLPDIKNKKVLDAGCAGGWYTKWILDHEADVIAIDFNKQMVEITKKRTDGKGIIKQADLNNQLDFITDNSVDIIIASLVLHYIKDWSNILSEFNRILKINGKLIFSVHHPFMDYLLFDRENYFTLELLNDEWLMDNEKIKVQFYGRPLSKIIQPVIDHGFIIEKLLEPMPTEEFKNAMPETYVKLTKQPQFLFIRANKI